MIFTSSGYPVGTIEEEVPFDHWGACDRKVTKVQRKDMERVGAVLYKRPFRENSRAKPAVPVLTTEEIMGGYFPPSVSFFSQFFTPINMGEEFFNMASPVIDETTKILEPSAGIGHLLYWALKRGALDSNIHAYEPGRQNAIVGNHLFPSVNWHMESPFGKVPNNDYDLVVMNPPFGSKMMSLDEASDNMGDPFKKKGELLFLALATNAVRADGVIMMIAPHGFWERMADKPKAWFEERIDLAYDCDLHGDFAHTGVRVKGYVFNKLRSPSTYYEPVIVVPPVPKSPYVGEQIKFTFSP